MPFRAFAAMKRLIRSRLRAERSRFDDRTHEEIVRHCGLSGGRRYRTEYPSECGKTTFLKLLTALYRPTRGGIKVDDLEIGPTNVRSYRNLFSAIFSDFYLFEKLHGLSAADPERVNALLRLMQISDKTAFSEGRFTNINLSTGQRKRLALVVSYLEDKPVYVFDEVAADQDPEFRKYFYETLLPEMKSAGKTVVVVSHDDRYFRAGDRVLQMDYGKLADLPAAPKKPRKRATKRAALDGNSQELS